MIKIGEFSQINKVTVKTLRLYDRIGLLKPKMVDEFNNYRFYDTDQLPIIQKIISLKQAGFSLIEIKKILKNEENFLEDLEIKKEELQSEIEVNLEKLKRVKNIIKRFKNGGNMNYNVVIKELPEVVVACRRLVLDKYNDLFKAAPEMGEMMKAQNLKCRVPEYCFNIYHDKEYREKDIDVEICEAVVKAGTDTDQLKFKNLKAVQAASLLHKGPYEGLREAYGFLIKWLEENGYEAADNFRESYIDGCWNRDNPADWLTEIQVPIKKK